MNWQSLVGASALALCASGCATGARRDLTSVGPRSPAHAGSAAPRQVHEPAKSDQPDPFLAGSAKPDRSRLTRYFPGLSRPAPEKPAATETSLVAARSPEAAPTAGLAAATPAGRLDWFRPRKPRGPQTYLTDARATASPRGAAVPQILPVALQLPRPATDGAVTTASREVATDAPAAVEPPAMVPSNPDASSAPATPPPATEPQLAVPLIDPPAAAAHPVPPPEAKPEADQPEAEAKPEVAPAEPKPEADKPEAKAEAPPADAPADAEADAKPEKASRGRPRLPSIPSTSYAEAGDTPQQGSPAADRQPGPAGAEAAKPAATPPGAKSGSGSAADPGNSLGLPSALLPASYTQHQSVAVRGSIQGNQPPPVLASPQVEPSPQAPAATAVEAKTWRRPCLRRLIRRTWHLGEFANPPTAPPH